MPFINDEPPEQPSRFKQLAQMLIGDSPVKGDEVQPTGSPIDLLAGGVGAKLGTSMAQGVGPVLGNEIGAIGSNIVPKSAPWMQNITQKAVNEAIPVGEGLVNSTKDNIYTQAAKAAAKFRNLNRFLKK